MNIFAGNLPFDATESDVKRLFEGFGNVASVVIVMEREKKAPKSRGFGFVEMPDEQEALAAIAALNAKEFMGRVLNVNPTRPKTEAQAASIYRKNKQAQAEPQTPQENAWFKPVFKPGTYKGGRRTRSYMAKRGLTEIPVEEKPKKSYHDNPMRWRKNKPGQAKPWQKSAGEHKPWEKSEEGARPWKKAEGERKPWKKTEGEFKPWRKSKDNANPWSQSVGDAKSWRKPEEGARPWKKSTGEVKPWRKSAGEARTWHKPEGSARPWKKPGSEAKPWRKPEGSVRPWKKPEGDAKPWKKTEGEQRPWKKAEGERKPWKKPEGEFKPWRKTEGSAQPWKKSAAGAKPWGKSSARPQESRFKPRKSPSSYKKRS